MNIRLTIDWETLNKIDDIGYQLNVSTQHMPTLIKSICDRVSELLKDFKSFFDTLLRFLEENNYDQSEIATLTLNLDRKYFKNR